MKVILFVFSLISIVSPSLFDDIFNVPDSVLAKIPLVAPFDTKCDDVKMNYCQVCYNF